MTFLSKTHNPNLITRDTPDKSHLRDNLPYDQQFSELSRSSKARPVGEAVIAKRSLMTKWNVLLWAGS